MRVAGIEVFTVRLRTYRLRAPFASAAAIREAPGCPEPSRAGSSNVMMPTSPKPPCQGACHCGAVRFEVADRPTSVKECDCSICSKLGVLWAYCPPSDFRVTSGAELRGSYVWGDKMIAFRFCPHCACMVNWEALPDRDAFADGSPPKVGFNARLIAGLDARLLLKPSTP